MTSHRIFSSVLLGAALSRLAVAGPGPADLVEIPVEVVENRFFAVPITPAGDHLRFYTDTGGGLFVFGSLVRRLGLPTETSAVDGEKAELARLPAFRREASIPGPLGGDGKIPVMPASREPKAAAPWDGMLGQAWFSGRVWTWDYPGRRLLWRKDGSLPGVEPTHRAPLGFKRNGSGKRETDFARIAVTIDGQALDLLLDTGAEIRLSPAALARLADAGPESRATSFIAATHFDGWRTKHPDWRVIEDADANVHGEPMIQVPEVTVAGYTVGPVWFTRRPDPNFHQFMSQWMDRTVEGALGGSALRFFRVSVDYPNAVAVFEKP